VAANLGRSDQTSKLTALAAAVFLIALALTALRAADVFSPSASVPGPSNALTETLEAIAGPGRVRVTQSQSAAGERTLFILRDRQSNASAADLKSIAIQASSFDLKAGDRVFVRDADFAIVSGSPSREDLAGLAAMVVLVFASGALCLLTLRPAPVQLAPTAPAVIDRATPAQVPTVARTPSSAADLVQRDPARAANVLRSWIANEGRS
jgi:hypothetical protein